MLHGTTTPTTSALVTAGFCLEKNNNMGGVRGVLERSWGVGRGDGETVVPGDDTPTSGFHPARDTETI